MKIDIRSLTLNEIETLMIQLGEPKFRAKQIYGFLSKGIKTFDEMHNLSKALIEKLKENCQIKNVNIIKAQKSKDGTQKFLCELDDHEVVETVFMKYKYGNSICISTQVGCKMKCTFCASTIKGMRRNLTTSEMLGQIYAAEAYTGEKINNVVMMGSGEPLDNYDNSVKFIKLATDEKGLNLSGRSITLSTCGLVPQIKVLADEHFQITLAISLHNPIEAERKVIMPITHKHGLEDLIHAVDYYIAETHRRVTFEYALIEGENDSEHHAKALGKLLKDKLVHVNLIPVNAVEEKNYHPTQQIQINRFKSILMDKYKINTTVRRELGSDINAACGQLRNEHIETQEA